MLRPRPQVTHLSAPKIATASPHMSAQAARWRPEIRTAAGSAISGSEPTGWPAAEGRLPSPEAGLTATPWPVIGFLRFQNRLKSQIWQAARRNNSLAGEDQACDLAHDTPELEEAPEVRDGERPELSVGAIHGLHEFEQVAHAMLRLGVRRPGFLQGGDTFTEHVEGWVHLPPLPLLQDDPEHLPDIPHRFEIIPPVPQHMRNLHNPPPLQLTQAGAHVRSGHRQRRRDLLGRQRAGRDVEQRVNLGDGPVDAPRGTHLAPVDDELADGG